MSHVLVKMVSLAIDVQKTQNIAADCLTQNLFENKSLLVLITHALRTKLRALVLFLYIYVYVCKCAVCSCVLQLMNKKPLLV